MIIIFKPEINFFPEVSSILRSRIEEYATIKEEISIHLNEDTLIRLYGDGFTQFPYSYSRDEILWIHQKKWGKSNLLLMKSTISVSKFRNILIGGIYFKEGTLRSVWRNIRDNSTKSLDFWMARGLNHIPTAPDSENIPDQFTPERLYLLLNGIHCPKDENEMRQDSSILAPLFGHSA